MELKRMQELAGITPEKQYRVVFSDYSDVEYPVQQLFSSEKEAEDFAESGEGEEDYWYTDEQGDDRVKIRPTYYNPEDRQIYYHYHIEEV